MLKGIKVPNIVATYDKDPTKESSWHFAISKTGNIQQYGEIATLVKSQAKHIAKLEDDLEAYDQILIWLYDQLESAKKQAIWSLQTEAPKDSIPSDVGSWKQSSCFDGVPHQWGVMNSKAGTKTYCAKCGLSSWLAKTESSCCGSDGYCCTGQHVFDEDAHKEPDWDPKHEGGDIHEYSPVAKLGKGLNKALKLVEETIEYGVMTHADADAEDAPCEECDETEESLDEAIVVGRGNFMFYEGMKEETI